MIDQVEAARRASKCILVLGMHRSGTSALSGALSLLGCDQPRTLMPNSPSNEKGHFESQKIYELHKDLLKSAGTSWDDWTEFYPNWFSSGKADEFQARALDLLKGEFGNSRLFALKDPRICRLVPFWLETLERFGAAPCIVLTHRNPLEVAASLKSRNDFELPFGLLLWLRHVLDAEAATRGRPRYFTSYDALLDNWPGVMQGIQKALGLNFTRMSDTVASEIDEFLTGPLQHFREKAAKVTDNPLLSQWIRTTYVILEKWAAYGEDITDHATLDILRRDFNEATPAFSRLVKDGQTVRKQIAESRAALTEIQDLLGDTEKRLSEETTLRLAGEKTLAEAAAHAEAQTTELQVAIQKVTITEADLALIAEEKRALEADVAARFRELGELTRILVQKDKEQERLQQAVRDTKHNYQAMLSSTSWRITAPLRRLIIFLRRR